ncbi:hypothetical protein ONZ45_g16368 [Pleurotus djamor]|nr:hypothetical protein ONZ45_g16368 [Pleurotus djamor]
MKLSRSAPLFVVSPALSSANFSEIDLARTTVEAAGSRIKRLSVDWRPLSVDPELIANALESMLSATTALQALRLNLLIGYKRNIYLPISTTSWTTSTSIQALDLHHVLIPTDTPKFPSLRKLDITYQESNPDAPRLSFSRVIQFLSGSPNLEEVTLATVSSTEPHNLVESSFGPFPIPLPHLRSFGITSDYLDGSHLFHYLELPPSAHINASYEDLRPNSTSPDLTNVKRLFSSFGFGSRPSAPSLDKMFINIDDYASQFGIKLYENASNDDSPFLAFTIPFILSAMDSYIQLCSSLPLSQVTELTFANADEATTSSHWSSLLPAFTNLTRFGVTCCNPAMQWTLVQTSPPSNIFLETICETDQQYSELDIPKHPTDEDLDTLCEAATKGLEGADKSLREYPLTLILIKARRDMGFPIQKYVIKHCAITPTQVDNLRRFIDVEWDGVEDSEDLSDVGSDC